MLDTNVISEPWKITPDAGVTRFLSSTPSTQTYLSLFTVTKLRYGINILAEGRRKSELERAYGATSQAYEPHILSPDLASAEVYARLAAEQRQAGTPRPIFD